MLFYFLFLRRKAKGKLYSFPVAALTNYHKLSGLKQHKLIILQFWRSEVQKGSLLGWNQDVGKAGPLSGGSWGKFTFLSFLTPWGCLQYLSYDHLPSSKFAKMSLSQNTMSLSPSSPSEGPCDYTGLICIIQDDLPILADLQSQFHLQL